MEDTYHILIPTDYSETADHALDVGITIAKRSNAQVQIQHIEGIPPDWVDMVEKEEGTMFTMIKEQLADTKTELADRVTLAQDQGVSTESFLQYNKNYRAILDHADDNKTDLIIMGAHGRSGIKSLLIGSYTVRVLHHTKTPVLVTKKTDLPNDLEKMVFVSDFSLENVDLLLKAFMTAQELKMTLSLLYINTPTTFKESHEIMSRIDRYLERIPGGKVAQVDVVNAYRFEPGLFKYCAQNKIDIVSMPIYKRTSSWEAFGGTIQDLIKDTDIPVLGIPED